jgi:hypothetical protein
VCFREYFSVADSLCFCGILCVMRIDTHGHARGTLTEFKLRLTGSRRKASASLRDAFTHG